MYVSCANYHTGPCQARVLLPEVLALIADGRFDPRPDCPADLVRLLGQHGVDLTAEHRLVDGGVSI